MTDSVWRGSRPFVRYPLCGHMCAYGLVLNFYGTQVWQKIWQHKHTSRGGTGFGRRPTSEVGRDPAGPVPLRWRWLLPPVPVPGACGLWLLLLWLSYLARML
jgi:hypothetical protein